jgi:hypothetical protein
MSFLSSEISVFERKSRQYIPIPQELGANFCPNTHDFGQNRHQSAKTTINLSFFTARAGSSWFSRAKICGNKHIRLTKHTKSDTKTTKWHGKSHFDNKKFGSLQKTTYLCIG